MAHKIFVTDANSTKALAIIRSLGTEYEVFAGSTDSIALGRFSKYCRKYIRYKEGSKNFIPEILNICKANEVDILITPEEQSSFLVAKNKIIFAENDIITTIAGFDAIKACMNKPQTLDNAQKVGIPFPRTEFVNSIDDVFDAAGRLGYPIVIRPVTSHYWTGNYFIRTGSVCYAKNKEELEIAFNKQDLNLPLPFLQEYFGGKGVSVLLAMDENNDVCAVAAQEGIREYKPTGGTLAVRRSIKVNETLLSYSSNLLKKIGYNGGVAEVEFRVSDNMKNVSLVEVNPRFWATVQGAINAGVDFPKILVRNVLKKEIPEPHYEVGVVTRWLLGDFIRFIRILKGKPKGYEGNFPSRWKGFVDFFGKQPENTQNEVLRFSDIIPAIVEFPCMLIKYIKRKLFAC
jgi:predicted ATP-grasp superfamily ATP-dependent carboligase